MSDLFTVEVTRKMSTKSAFGFQLSDVRKFINEVPDHALLDVKYGANETTATLKWYANV